MTHLVQLLGAASPADAGVERVTVWGSRTLLDLLPDRPWLQRVHEPALDAGAVARAAWQQRRLARLARHGADLLFAPGGTYLGSFRPFVTMFRNMLPFDPVERRRYGLSTMRAKLEALRRVQAATFRRATGVIFLTEHARAALGALGVAPARHQAVIPHGLDAAFFRAPRLQEPWEAYSGARPFRWLYVSAMHVYKHPWSVVEAAGRLRAAGMPVALHLAGPVHPSARSRLQSAIDRVDPARAFITVVPAIPHAELPAVYAEADGFVFASTCENLPNSLLEAMASGLPAVCSERPPMPQILGDGGVYCDPADPARLAGQMARVMRDPVLRGTMASAAFERARRYTWTRCASATFQFLAATDGAGRRRGDRGRG